MAIMNNMPKGEFSVYWWDVKDNQHEEVRFTDPATVAGCVKRLCKGPAAMLGVIKRVIVTDGGDCINFEWKDGKIIYNGTEQPK